MVVNSAQAGGGGGCTTFLFHTIYHHEQSCGAPAERTCDTILLCGIKDAKRTVLVLYVRTYMYLTHYPSTDRGKIISDKLFISDFLSVKLNFNLFDFHYIFPALNTTLQSFWKVHIKDCI
jgi:hypothetical protein